MERSGNIDLTYYRWRNDWAANDRRTALSNSPIRIRPLFRVIQRMSTHKSALYQGQGSIWQELGRRITGWFRPTHPRFGLHLFLIALASGLLLSLAWLAVHGIAQQFRHAPVAADASVGGPGSALPTPMAGGKAALSAAGTGQASSWSVQDGGQPVPDSATGATAENDSIVPDAADIGSGAGDATPVAANDAAAPNDENAPEMAPAPTITREATRIGQQTEVTFFVQIDEQGNPVQITLKHSSGSPAVDSAALLTLQNRHFPPVLRDGEPVPATLTVPVQMQAPEH
jgi:TonB family protein